MSNNIQWQGFKLTDADRAKIKHQQPLCLRMTCLSGPKMLWDIAAVHCNINEAGGDIKITQGGCSAMIYNNLRTPLYRDEQRIPHKGNRLIKVTPVILCGDSGEMHIIYNLWVNLAVNLKKYCQRLIKYSKGARNGL